MLQKIIIIAVSLLALATNIAQAQLSSNPWLEANDKETVEAIYNQHRKRHGNTLNTLDYQEDEHITIDRTNAYLQEEDLKSDEDGFLDKIKNKLKDEPQNQALIPATQANRQAISHRQEQKSQASSSNINNLKKSLRLPNMPNININRMINKFERMIGVDFKSIGRRLQ